MKTKLITHTEGSRRLILIFTGWSTSPDLYAHLRADGWDIMIVYDYTDLSPLPEDILSPYSTIFVLAWSLGVATAEAALSPYARRISAAFAVNGTLHPASDDFGIPSAIYEGTLRNLSPRNLLKFQKRISSPRDTFSFPLDPAYPENADIDALKAELHNIASITNQENYYPALPWKKAYISSSDRIFPPESQRRAWKRLLCHSCIAEIDAGHYLPLQHVINDITPDVALIGSHFRKALSTYDSNADAQGKIAITLLKMLPPDVKQDPQNILEIGPGSGMLTRLLNKHITIAKASFIELYPLPEFRIAPEETYFTGDAEELIETLSGFDLIISASTIQWFADPARFFRNAFNALKPGGALLCSTFLPGNLRELDAMRPTPLIYRTREELTQALKEAGFTDITTNEEEITKNFTSRRQLLLHLKSTGVAGGYTLPSSSPRGGTPHSASSPTITTLTYCPLYIRASRPSK